MRKVGLVTFVLLCLPILAGASVEVCPPSIATDAPTIRDGVDPSQVRPGCSLILKTQTAAQKALYQSVVQANPVPGARYLKVVGTAPNGILAEKDAMEKAAVDTVITTEQAKATELTDAASDPICQATKAQIQNGLQNRAAVIQTDIDAVTNIATAKTALTTMKTEVFELLYKIALCVAARTGGLQ